jgi:hypothetical protein
MRLHRLLSLTPVVFAVAIVVAAQGQQGRWAAADDATAKFIIDAEWQWAESVCTHGKIAERILADDFQGTSTNGQRYTKSEELTPRIYPRRLGIAG